MSQQHAILSEYRHASFLMLDRKHGVSIKDLITQLAGITLPSHVTVGLGSTLISGIAGMRPMPTLDTAIAIPRTPADVWVRITGEDPGQVMHRERAFLAQLDVEVADRTEGFAYDGGRDLTGYEDGTENPTGDDAIRTAFAQDGSSVLAVLRWVHDFSAFDALDKTAQDHSIGRERVRNDELEDAPPSAHVKRTAQENFEPEAFLLRRSMPWRDHRGAGLVFLSFSATLDPFESQLRRMVGLDDGIVDGLFQYTRPVTGAVFWCPPLEGGRLQIPG